MNREGENRCQFIEIEGLSCLINRVSSVGSFVERAKMTLNIFGVYPVKIDMSSHAFTMRLKMVNQLRCTCLSPADSSAGKKYKNNFQPTSRCNGRHVCSTADLDVRVRTDGTQMNADFWDFFEKEKMSNPSMDSRRTFEFLTPEPCSTFQ